MAEVDSIGYATDGGLGGGGQQTCFYFFRVRCLDGIPFNQQLKFDFELLGWENGTVDYSSTVFWYGDLNSQAAGSSGIEEIEAGLLPTPTQSPVCSIANAIDFCQIQPTSKSDSEETVITIKVLHILSGLSGKWSQMFGWHTFQPATKIRF